MMWATLANGVHSSSPEHFLHRTELLIERNVVRTLVLSIAKLQHLWFKVYCLLIGLEGR